MYLKKIVCEHMGPITNLDIEPGFNGDGCPKPLLLVGKNGSGKSILISNIVDSFFEFGEQAFTDLTKKVNLGHAYFKVASKNQIQIGENHMVSYLQYKSFEGHEKYEFLYKQGECNYEQFKQQIGEAYKPTINLSNNAKATTSNKTSFEKEFQENTICYFPPERYTIPYWMNIAYSNKNEYGSIGINHRYDNVLGKPIIASYPTEDNIKWLFDVIIDSNCNTANAFDNNNISISINCLKPSQNVTSLSTANNNIETILSDIIEKKVQLKLNHRNSGHSRILLHSSSVPVVPTLDALSTGQAILFDIFATIIRYSDQADIHKAVKLNEIKGIVVIDEIELHLHSDLQRKILPSLIKRFPKVQFIITTHSPLFLLGMREQFGEEGFDIYQMPNGQKIGVEQFSEFQTAYDYMTQTQKYREDLQAVVDKYAEDSNRTLIITEGATDWKHMKRAWLKLKDCPDYAGIVNNFEFLEYEPPHNLSTEAPKLQMSESELVNLCIHTAKLKQTQKIIFISDADKPNNTKKLKDTKKDFKDWGNNVYSFQIPVPPHRVDTPEICIEHYYTDEEIKTKKKIAGINRRLFMGNEFDERGLSLDQKYFCIARNECGEDKISILEGDSKTKITLVSDKKKTVALPKMKFAEAILSEEGNFANIDSDNFKLIFDIIKQIISE